MQMIDNASHWWRFTSTQLNLFALACDGAFIGVACWYESFPMSPILYAGLRMALTVAATVAHMCKQRLPA